MGRKKQRFVLKGHNSNVNCIALSDNSEFIASGSSDSSVQVWSIKTKLQVAVAKDNRFDAISVAFLRGHTLVAFVVNSCEIKILNFVSKTIIKNITTRCLNFCILASNIQPFFIIGSDSIINFFNLEQIYFNQVLNSDMMAPAPIDLQPYKSLGVHGDMINCLLLSYDESKLISGSKNSMIIVWNLSTNQEMFYLRGSEGVINSFAFTSKEEYLLSSSSDQTLRLWSMSIGNQIKQFNSIFSPILCIFKYNKDFLLLSKDSKIGYFNTNDKEIQVNEIFKYYAIGTETPIFDKKFIAYAKGKTAVIWDLKNDKEKCILDDHKEEVLCIEISFDLNFAITCSEGKDCNLLYWNLKTNQVVGVLNGHTDSVLCASFSLDNIHAASGSKDMTVRLWNLQTCIQEVEFRENREIVTSVKFMSNKEMLVSSGSDNLVIIWNIIKQAKEAMLQENSNFGNNFLQPSPLEHHFKQPISLLQLNNPIIPQLNFRNNFLQPSLENHFRQPIIPLQLFNPVVAQVLKNIPKNKIFVTENDRYVVSYVFGQKMKIWNFQRKSIEKEFDKEAEAKKWLRENKISMKLVRRYFKL